VECMYRAADSICRPYMEAPQANASCVSLQGLWLHGNLLESIPDSIGDLENLEILSLAGNCLSVLPEGIGNLAVHIPTLSLPIVPAMGDLNIASAKYTDRPPLLFMQHDRRCKIWACLGIS